MSWSFAGTGLREILHMIFTSSSLKTTWTGGTFHHFVTRSISFFTLHPP
jgi:hypothetical protein